jgi:opacity protein-like surface antigen
MAYRSGVLAAGLLLISHCLPVGAQDASPQGAGFLTFASSGTATEDWSGFYVGASVGTPRGENTWTVRGMGMELVPDAWSGSAVSMTFGRDWQSGRLTYGGLVSLGAGLVAAAPTSAFFFTCVACETTVEDLMTVRGRLGLAAGRSHLFATGGFARANVAATNVGGAVLINDDALSGWTLGVGLEHLIGEGLSLALTYDRIDLGALDLSTYNPQTESDISFGLVQVGMNLRW